MKLETYGIREIGRLAERDGFSLSPGYISKTTSSLVSQGYASKQADGSIALRRKRELLDDWTHVYQKSSHQEWAGFFLPVADMDDLTRRVGRIAVDSGALSDRAGASLVDPHAAFDSVLLMASDFEAAGRALTDAGARVVERGANIDLVRPLSRFHVLRSARDRRMQGRFRPSTLS